MDGGCLGCSTGLGAAKSEGPDPVLPTLGKAKVDFVAGVVSGLVVGVGWLVGNVNVDAGAVVGLEVVGGAGVTGLEKKLGTVALVVVVVVSGSGFVVEAGIVAAGLAKNRGAAGCTGAGTVVEDVGAGVGAANKFFAGSLVSVAVVVPVVGFGCVEATEVGWGRGTGGREGVVGAGAGAGEGFVSATFFWS